MTIPEIIKSYRDKAQLNQTQFASALTEEIPGELVKQQISFWENGVQKPNYYFLVILTLKYHDWRRDMALECLRVLRPDLYTEPELETSHA